MPKGPINKVYHVLNIPEKEQEFIRELAEDLIDKWRQGKAIRAVGEAVKGILSHPAGLMAVLSAVGLAFLLSPFGREALEKGSEAVGAAARSYWSSFIDPVLIATGVPQRDLTSIKLAWVNSILDSLRGLTPFF